MNPPSIGISAWGMIENGGMWENVVTVKKFCAPNRFLNHRTDWKNRLKKFDRAQPRDPIKLSEGNTQNRHLFSFPISILPLLFSCVRDSFSRAKRCYRGRDKQAFTNGNEREPKTRARFGVSKVDQQLGWINLLPTTIWRHEFFLGTIERGS